MINGLITKGMLKEFEDLFTEMVEKGHTPDDITYNIMVRGSLLHNDIDKAMQLLNAMIDRGFSLNATNISMVEDLLATHGPKSNSLIWLTKFCQSTKVKLYFPDIQDFDERRYDSKDLSSARTCNWRGHRNEYICLLIAKSAVSVNLLSFLVETGDRFEYSYIVEVYETIFL
ncbi:hypothetical protein GIB67_017152 [Kingdonia uniflora]|uniref:Pentatricopeptide repeat-containing protein n=1 Tax=Kingdonia uniflora TaxID=39325 RepID=A0A7J7NWY1_9MAGN|nr:hypothetical protein GIB67_017152 [Kingdonia uniflora]